MTYEYTNRREVLKWQHFSFFCFTAGACAPACCAKNPCDRETAAACAEIFAMKYAENAYMMQDFLREVRCMDQTRRACVDGFSTFLEKILQNA